MLKKSSIILIGLLVFSLLMGVLPAPANQHEDMVDTERQELFLASRRLEEEQNRLPRTRAGLFVTNFGTGENNVVNVGAKAEMSLDDADKLRAVAEGIYLEEDKELAGFVSIKALPFEKGAADLYFGAGAGVADGLRFQAFTGVELGQNFYAEAKYIHGEDSFYDSLFFAAGFQLTF